MNKKVIAIWLLAALCVGGLSGCGNSTEPTPTKSESPSTTPSTTQDTPTTGPTAGPTASPTATLEQEDTNTPTPSVSRDASTTLEYKENGLTRLSVVLEYDASNYNYDDGVISNWAPVGRFSLTKNYSSYSDLETEVRQLLDETPNGKDALDVKAYTINGYTYYSMEYYDFLDSEGVIFNEKNYIYVQVSKDVALVFYGRFYNDADEFINSAMYISSVEEKNQ